MVADNERLASSLHWPLFTERALGIVQLNAPEFALAIQQFFEYVRGRPSYTDFNMTAVYFDEVVT